MIVTARTPSRPLHSRAPSDRWNLRRSSAGREWILPGSDDRRRKAARRSAADRAWGGIMWKSVFLATGMFACLVGAELLLIDSAAVKPINGAGQVREITAPDWAPWALISAGAVTILHFCTGGGSASGNLGGMPKPGAGKFPQI